MNGPGSIPSNASFSLSHSVETNSGAHFLPIYRWIKQQEPEAYHSPPSISEVQKSGAITPLLQTSSWHSAYII
jgi:hypothetical protein